MIVEYIESVTTSHFEDKSVKLDLYYQVGQIMHQFHSITNDQFGHISYLVQGKYFQAWYWKLLCSVK